MEVIFGRVTKAKFKNQQVSGYDARLKRYSRNCEGDNY
jgi:hypothetical protein